MEALAVVGLVSLVVFGAGLVAGGIWFVAEFARLRDCAKGQYRLENQVWDLKDRLENRVWELERQLEKLKA